MAARAALEKDFRTMSGKVRLSVNEFRGWYHATNRLANPRTGLRANSFRANRRKQRGGNAALTGMAVLRSPVTRLYSR